MKFLSALFAVVLMSSSAFASIYLEPSIGYETGKIEGGATSNDLAGTNLGLKLGYSSLGFAAGLDYMRGSLKQDSSPSVTWTNQDLGVFAQFTFPILIKVSGTYFFSTEMEKSGKMTGNGTKVGIGYTGLPFLSINFDMINLSYDKFKNGGNSVNIDADRKTWMLSLSLPLNL
ncbi:MAG: porin [Bdellovibrionaceae bacterium]|nr:porin [Pseudobdellovibrionaceae bacterium]